MKNKNIFISGVSGSGRDFILEKLDLPPNSKCFHFGDFLKESAERIENQNFKSGEIGKMSEPKIDFKYLKKNYPDKIYFIEDSEYLEDYIRKKYF